jgi:DNA invertase Pin-like site-specific DNA recombinase
LTDLKVGFISLTEAIDLTTPTGRALTGMLAVFAEFERDILRERIKAGIDQSRMNGKPPCRPPRSALIKASKIAKLHAEGVSKSKIASTLGIGRTSVRRILSQAPVGASSLKDRNSDPQVGLIIFKP